MRPARNMSWWLMTSASAGVSLKVVNGNRLSRMVGGSLDSWVVGAGFRDILSSLPGL